MLIYCLAAFYRGLVKIVAYHAPRHQSRNQPDRAAGANRYRAHACAGGSTRLVTARVFDCEFGSHCLRDVKPVAGPASIQRTADAGVRRGRAKPADAYLRTALLWQEGSCTVTFVER